MHTPKAQQQGKGDEAHQPVHTSKTQGCADKPGLAPLPCYADWLILTHANTIYRWGWLFVCVMVASAFHPIGSLLLYRLFSLGFGIAAARIAFGASKGDTKQVREMWVGPAWVTQALTQPAFGQ